MPYRPLYQIAQEIRNDWSKQGKGINYAAKPYLEAMFALDKMTDKYGADDAKGIVIACASSIEADVKSTGLRGKTMAVKVGNLVAERAKNAGISAVVFDRNGFTYHGRIQVLADSAREAGLQF